MHTHGTEPSLTVNSFDTADGRAVVLGARGEVDAATAPTLRRAIHEVLTHAQAINATAVVIDLGAVEFMSSPGLGVLIVAHDKAQECQVDLLVATGSQPGVLRPLEATHLMSVLDAHPTVDDALRRLDRADRR